MDSKLFYQKLASFSSFDEITQDALFEMIPRDWKVIITDVKGSTQAINEGRYKDVNTIGAATIVAANKGMTGADFPYVFGGDGATLVVPEEKLDLVGKELLALQRLSKNQFGLELRVGVVDVGELLDEGAQIKVAKFELRGGKCIAIFKGGGLNLAEAKVKGQEEKYRYARDFENEVDLSSLSCRWNPIPSKRGQIVSILVEGREKDSNQVYQDFLAKLDSLLEGGLNEANPVNIDQASYKSFGECLKNEKRLHSSPLSPKFILRFLEIALSVLVFKFKAPPLIFNPDKYARSMRPHSDYRKFDDMLRMVIDCSREQISEIEKYLEQGREQGKLFYGVHKSNACLMTCYVDNLQDGNHIHFIDGGDGGYAMAAKQLKLQMAKA